MPNYYPQIAQLIEEGGGYLFIKRVTENQIPRVYAYDYLRDHEDMRKVAPGIYARKDINIDNMYVIQCRHPEVIFSFESAAYLGGLLSVEPLEHIVTVPSRYHNAKMPEKKVKYFQAEQKFLDMGKKTVTTKYGHMVNCYDNERTVCDIVRHKDEVNAVLFKKVLKAYFGLENVQNRNLMRLREYSKTLHIEKKIEECVDYML